MSDRHQEPCDPSDADIQRVLAAVRETVAAGRLSKDSLEELLIASLDALESCTNTLSEAVKNMLRRRLNR